MKLVKFGKKTFFSHKRGFTLIELSIYTGLVAVFLITLINMFLATLDVQLEAQASSAVDQEGRFIMARINRDIHRASSILTPATIGQTVDTLSLEIDGVTHTYSLSGQTLWLDQSGTSGSLNSYETMTPVFTVTRIGYPDGIPSVQINMTLQSVTVSQGQNPQTRSYQTSVTLR